MIEITDEMVDVVALALLNAARRARDFPDLTSIYDAVLPGRFQTAGRAVLSAVAPLIAAAEREECARVADTYQAEADTAMMNPYGDECWYEFKHGKAAAARDIADDIRARGASCA